MSKISNKGIWLLLLQLPTLLAAPVVMLWSNTPTNILNASRYGGGLAFAGSLGSLVILLLAIPVGVIGVVFARKHAEESARFWTATKALSIVNIIFGALEAGVLLIIFISAVFFGISV